MHDSRQFYMNHKEKGYMKEIRNYKQYLRDEIREKMRAMDPEKRKEADGAICRTLTGLPEFREAKTVLCFIGVDWEIDTTPILEEALRQGKTLAVPLCVDRYEMKAKEIRSLSELSPGVLDIPAPTADTRTVPAEEIDLAVVPCVACDKSFYRLGQGRGYFDRFLAGTGIKTAALCREDAMVSELPVQAWDVPMDCVITEKGLIRK